jgi:hypothetical protein
MRVRDQDATCHVMVRVGHGQTIFQDDQDRERPLETVGGACGKAGFRIHATASG